MINFRDDSLFIEDKIITFKFKIKKIINLNLNTVILLEECLTKINLQSNLFLYSSEGNKIWEAPLNKERTPSLYDPKAGIEQYYDINLHKDKLYACTTSWIIVLNHETGNIEERHVNRFP